MSLPDAITVDMDGADSERPRPPRPTVSELDILRRSAGRFHTKMDDTLSVVSQLARGDGQFADVARAVTAAMVSVELTIAVMGDEAAVPVTVFDGAVIDWSEDASPAPEAKTTDDRRRAWERA